MLCRLYCRTKSAGNENNGFGLRQVSALLTYTGSKSLSSVKIDWDYAKLMTAAVFLAKDFAKIFCWIRQILNYEIRGWRIFVRLLYVGRNLESLKDLWSLRTLFFPISLNGLFILCFFFIFTMIIYRFSCYFVIHLFYESFFLKISLFKLSRFHYFLLFLSNFSSVLFQLILKFEHLFSTSKFQDFCPSISFITSNIFNIRKNKFQNPSFCQTYHLEIQSFYDLVLTRNWMIFSVFLWVRVYNYRFD